MALRKLALKTTKEHQGKRLDQVLAEWLPLALAQPMSKGKVRKLIVAGAVYLNGKRVRIASKELQPNAKVEAYVDMSKLNTDGPAQDLVFEMSEKYILFEDDYLIAVNKPPGLPTQPTLDEARNNLYASLKKFMTRRDPKAYVGLHHRLDRDTSGVVLFTKRTDINAGVAELFSSHLAVKTYNAISIREGALPPKEWTIKNYLAKSREKKSIVKSVHSGGDFAQTDFRLLEVCPGGLWIEARPKTGRTHQIRVHLAEAGLPIRGDATYGRREVATRLMLHAVNLTFPHPITKVLTSIQSPLPEDFQECLSQIRKPKSSG